MRPALRVFAVLAIFAAATVAWVILGGVTTWRSHDRGRALEGQVAELWGSPHRQAAPVLKVAWTTEGVEERTEQVGGAQRQVRTRKAIHHERDVAPSSTDLAVGLRLDQRRKGLRWYSLYDVDFAGRWTYEHRDAIEGELRVSFAFPDPQGLYDDFRFAIDGQSRADALVPAQGQVSAAIPLVAGQTVTLEIAYRARGMDAWHYAPAPGVANLERFHVAMTTDFEAIDFPPSTMSPSSRARAGAGWKLDWRFARVVTGHGIGMVMPARLQPGELAAALSFSAPISLLFFFLLLFVLGTLRRLDFHPMHYVFVAAAFFSFHLLFGYTVDHLPVVPAFAIASLVSLFLIVTYLRLVVSSRFAFVEAGLGQLVYLVGFSLAHFWEGYTGLTVTVLSIATLFLMMQLTGRVRWSAPERPAGAPA